MMIFETRTGCAAQAHDTGHAYRKYRCRCPKARAEETARKNHQKRQERSPGGRAYRSFTASHRGGTYAQPGVPPFFLDPRRACATVNPEVMFPNHTNGPAVSAAVKVCAGCPFKQACNAWAVDTAQAYGVWGGVTEAKRRQAIFKTRQVTA